MPAASTQSAHAARILLVSSERVPLAAWREALMATDASCTLTDDVRHAADLCRRTRFDGILIAARGSDPETVLLGQLLRGTALGRPRLNLVSSAAVAVRGHDFDAHCPVEPTETDVKTLLSSQGASPAPTRRVAASTAIAVHAWPEPWTPAGPGEPAEVIVTHSEQETAALLADLPPARAAIVPIIAVGDPSCLAGDIHVPSRHAADLARAFEDAEPIVAAIERLPPTWFETTDARLHVLARLAVRRDPALPVRDGRRKAGIYHPAEVPIPAFRTAAEDLVRTGHVKQRFFDRVHVCPQCDSARLNVREECARCRSADVVEEAILHHLRCGFQGPQRDFQSGRALVCPKCRNCLEHFSVDYDKPGFVYCCNDCSQVTGDTAIGFACFDCSAHHDASQVATRTYHAYELTELGREAAFMAPRPQTGQGSDARDSLLAFAEANRGQPHALLIVRLDADGTTSGIGPDLFARTLALAHSLLIEVFTDEVEIVARGPAFVALIPGESADNVRAAAPAIIEHVRSMLRPPASVSHDVLGPEQVALFL